MKPTTPTIRLLQEAPAIFARAHHNGSVTLPPPPPPPPPGPLVPITHVQEHPPGELELPSFRAGAAIDEIILQMCRVERCTRDELLSKNRELAKSRIVIYYVAHKLGYRKLHIARALGLDHGTISHGIARCQQWMEQSSIFRDKVDAWIKYFSK